MADILAGLRVIEVGQVLAGPYAGAIFADLGAEVVKVERAVGGDVVCAVGRFAGKGSHREHRGPPRATEEA